MPADSVWVWLSALVLYDFCYYWAHRCGHEIGLFWAAHVVHHQSEAFNLSTALRQTSTGTLSFVFYLPMALLGWLMEGRAIGRWLEFGRLAATPLLPALAARWFDVEALPPLATASMVAIGALSAALLLWTIARRPRPAAAGAAHESGSMIATRSPT